MGILLKPINITINPNLKHMKKIILSSIVLLQLVTCRVWSQTPSSSQNYVMETILRVSDKTTASSLTGLNVAEANRKIQYLDGLGRPIQTVQWMGSPQQKDFVQLVAYDGFGRESLQYLPYAEQYANDGAFKPAAISSQSNFYSSGSWDANVSKTAYPFEKTLFESSPLNRILEQGAAGLAWQPAASRTTSAGRTVALSEDVNSVSDGVKLWSLGSNGASSSQVYQSGTLYKNVIKDENWVSGHLNTIEEFKDKQERVILKRTWETASTAHDTYYLYDDIGNLRYVLPPAVSVNSFIESDVVFTRYIYGYSYDNRKRNIRKHIPGKGWEEYVYNNLDQLVMSQDANGKLAHSWVMSKYDAIGRLIITGIYEDNISREALQNSFNSCIVLSESRSGFSDYTNLACPTTGVYTYLTINYYDDYYFLSMGATYPASSAISAKTKGLLTGTKVFKVDGSAPIWTLYYYDEDGRVKETIGGNHLSGTDRVVNAYNFAGELTSSTRTHVSGSSTTTIANAYLYDHVGRKLGTTSNINGQPLATVLNRMEYNEVGQLKQKHLHSSDGGITFMQSTKFAYNERGWLKNSSSPQYSVKLGYDTLSNPQFNGNIRTQLWGSTYSNRFDYLYDGLDRLTSAISAGVAMSETVSYDPMGNISSLVRDGLSGTYNYNGNQLSGVTGTFSTGSYGYDANGNAIVDGRAGVVLSYNILDLPATASRTGLSLAYTYDANGKKLKKVATTSGTTITDYVDGIQYTNGTIEFIQTEEGRALNSSGNYSYQYNLTDHLGNVRYSFDIYGGAVRRLQEDEYYAFGLRKSGSPVVLDNKYLFNGKELQDELGQYDYGARFYDPVVGRWNTPDPLADEDVQIDLSPYQYAWNNPVKLIDPDGRCPDHPCDGSCGMSMSAELGFIGSDIQKAVKDLPSKVLSFTDVNDVTVLVTTLTRGSKAINVDGTTATWWDKASSAGGLLIPFVSGSAVKKLLKPVGEKVVDIVTHAGQKVDAKTGQKVGPSGKAMVHTVRHASEKRAKDAARQGGKGSPVKHTKDAKGGDHYHHGTGKTGKGKGTKDYGAKAGKKSDNVHHEYAGKKKKR